MLSNLACLPSWCNMAFSRTGLFFCKLASYPFPDERTNSQEKAQGHSTLAFTLKQKQAERPHSTHFISLKPTSRFFICERFMFCYPSPDSVWTWAHRSRPSQRGRLTFVFESMFLPLALLKPKHLYPKVSRSLFSEDADSLGLTRIRKSHAVAGTILALISQRVVRGTRKLGRTLPLGENYRKKLVLSFL